jgi:hypothetical protein
MSQSVHELRVAVVATTNGLFTFEIFVVCGEPLTLYTDSRRYTTPDEAARAGREAIVSKIR